MSSDDARKKVHDNLSKLLEDKEFSEVHPFLERLRQWSSAGIWTPEIFAGFVEIFQRINAAVQAGGSLPDLLDQVSTGKFVQPDMKVNDLYQANGNIYKGTFIQFNNESSLSQPKPIEVPIVLLVMNADEARELVSLAAFQDYPTKVRNDFTRLVKRLAKEIPDWQNRYQSYPELWQPFSDAPGATSIKQLIVDASDIAQKKYEERNEQATSFSPSFKDIRTINDDRISLKRLRNNGCVIIMDSISMCHPSIFRKFQQSLLDVYSNTFVMIFAPTRSILEDVRNMTAIFQFCLSDLEFFKRLNDHEEEIGACEEICEESRFQLWLKNRLWKTMDSKASNPSEKKKSILNHINNFNR